MTPKKALDRAKVALMTRPNSVFLSTVLFGLQQSFNKHIPTAGTGGTDLVLNPDWFVSLTEEERVGLLCHEVMHVVWNHMERGKNLDRARYNVAADHIINLQLLGDGFKLPKGGHWDKKYKGMSTRQVYDLLPATPPPPKGSGSTGQGSEDPTGGTGDIIFNEGPTDSGKEMTIQNIVMRAMTQAEMANNDPGSIPANVRRMVDKLINPKLPWQTLLANYMDSYAKEDYSWRRPNRRFMPDFYLPGQQSDKLGTISAAVDLSGSVSKEQLRAFLSELSYIQQTMKPETLNILSFDTKIHSNHDVKEGDEILDLEMIGGGGTHITPVLKYFNKQKPVVAIIFTDTEFEDYSVKVDFDVIWIIIDNENVTMKDGVSIHYSTRNI